jgi:UDP:flavonoid glycosyltransferase YjiC (YdhE family)
MRVLVVSAPLLGHLMPLLPLASALRAAGHEVLLAAGGDAAGGDTAGLPVRDVAGGLRFGAVALRVTAAHPLRARRELAGRGGTAVVGELFGRVNASLADAVVALVGEWRPDLVIHEPLAVAGAFAAARHGVPAVLQENSLWDGPGLVAATATSPAMRRCAARHGVPRIPAPAATITVAPPGLVGPRPGWPMRAVPTPGGGEAPAWLLRAPDRPRIIVSRSTVAGPPIGDPMRPVVAAAGAVDAEIVLVRPPAAVTRRPLPPNVRTVGWVPLAEVLPHATAFVHHAGAGSVLGALAAACRSSPCPARATAGSTPTSWRAGAPGSRSTPGRSPPT